MSAKSKAELDMLKNIQKQLRKIEKRLDALEAVSHEQPDMTVMLEQAKNVIREVKRRPNASSIKSVVKC